MKKLIYLLLIWTLIFSCNEKKTPKKISSNSDFVTNAKTDTLKFTSGVRAIFQDSKGNYWFGSHGEGISRFDGKSFEYFTIDEGLSDNHILSIQEGDHGVIWFGTLSGVSSYDGKTVKTVTPSENGISQHIELKTDNRVLQSEWMKTDTDLWFNAGIKEGVYRYDGHTLKYLPFPKTKAMNTGNVYSVTGFSKGKDNMLWVGTFAGVFGYNGSDFTIINDETLGFKDINHRVHIRSILEDSKGRLWIGNNGIGVLLKEGDSISNFSKRHRRLIPMNEFRSNIKKNQFSRNTGLQSVFAIAEDHDGNIWFGERDTGAWKYDGASMTNYTIDEQLTSQMVWSIYEDQHKNLLFAMASGGVYQFNGTSFDKRF